MGVEEHRCIEQEAGCCGATFICTDTDVGDPRAVVHSDVQIVVTRAFRSASSAALPPVDAMAAAVWYAGELLDVQVQKFSRAIASVANGHTGRAVLITKAGNTIAAKYFVDRGTRVPQSRTQRVRPTP
jgi:hypothetical protein